jgi:hypothetical protein
MRIKTFLFAVLLLCSVPCIAAPEEAAPESQVKVVSAEFGLLNENFQSATKVPLEPGQQYGLILQLETKKDTIHWREEFTLPAVPKTWGSEELEGEQVVSEDQRTSVTQREVPLEDGTISNFWEVAAGDPPGHYTIRVFVEDTLAATFEFDVEEPGRSEM